MKKLLIILFLATAFTAISQNLPKPTAAEQKTQTAASIQRTPTPNTVTPCAGGNVSIPSNVSGTTYQWQVNSGSGFTNITNGGIYSDATTPTLQITGAPSSLYGNEYRCFVNSSIYSTVYILKFVSTWTGASDNAWENPSNWNCNAVPDGNTDVIINSGIVFLNTKLSVRSLSLSGGANVSVKTGAKLTVVGDSTALNFILIGGDSNAGGFAANSDATPTELAPRSEVQIRNNNTGVFENLDVGTNNMLGHTGLATQPVHGMELELANLVAAGTVANPTYLIKNGHGGAQLHEIIEGGRFEGTVDCWGLMRTKIEAAITASGGNKFAYFLSEGGNDAIHNINVATWKAMMIQYLADIRALYGKVPVVMMKVGTGFPNHAIYNTAIEEICATVPYTWFVEVTGISFRDAYHPDYAGMKILCNRMVNKLKEKGYIF